VLIQGVDTEVFKPVDRNPNQHFTVFSGGKFEWRKGQDLVIRAFAEFLRRGYKAHLVAAWFNQWPSLVSNAVLWSGLKYPKGDLAQTSLYRELCTLNGIPAEHVTVCEPMNHADTARTMGACHAGLFLNRCEGGTNLVLMEYAATRGAVIANTMTGHSDVRDLVNFEIDASENQETHWAEMTIDAIVRELMSAHLRYDKLPEWKPDPTKVPTWEQTALTVANTVHELWR
jgi:glycosyltransferase involved in cell wall biosynthesis